MVLLIDYDQRKVNMQQLGALDHVWDRNEAITTWNCSSQARYGTPRSRNGVHIIKYAY